MKRVDVAYGLICGQRKVLMVNNRVAGHSLGEQLKREKRLNRQLFVRLKKRRV